MKDVEIIGSSSTKNYIGNSRVEKHNGQSFLINRVISRIQKAEKGRIEIKLPNGTAAVHIGPQAGENVVIHFTTWKSIFQYVVLGELPFVEAYIRGDIIISSLSALFHWYVDNESYLSRSKKNNFLLEIVNRFSHLILNDNNKRGSRSNISFHYDLGNAFYKAWLDPSMTYSAGIFSENVSLEDAQHFKYARIVDQLNLTEGDSVLEIGCGWGGFAEHALERNDIDYKGITISEEQLNYTNERLGKFAQSEQLAHFEDYRETKGSYDKIVSIEMFEAVGEKHWDTYFATLKERLGSGGTAVIQVITIDHDRYLKYRNRVDFIQKYIFPGGMLPSKKVFREYAKKAGFEIKNEYAFGSGYAETLRRWKDGFVEKWPEIKRQGFDQRFYRMWIYYLDYCIAAFDRNTIDVMHFTLNHKQEKQHD